MTTASVHLALEEVRKVRHEGNGPGREILKGVTASVAPARITVIIGPSGGGKSTLVRLINRLEDPTSGRILLSGRDISDIDPLTLRRRVGLVTQKPFMFPGTVRSNLDIIYRFRGEAPPGADAEEIGRTLERCRLPARLLSQEARFLSLGEQQRVSLARVLLGEPELLLLDEPTSALDRPTAAALAETLAEVCRAGSLTLLMVTHDLRLAEQVADHLAYLEDGRILEEGPAGNLLPAPRTEALKRFLALPERNLGNSVI